MSPTYEQVEKVLETQVAPYLLSHDGGIRLKSVDSDGSVRVVFLGSCNNCPSMGDTLLNTVQAALERAFPKSHLQAIAVNDVNDDLWDIAKQMLRKKNK